VYNDIVNSYNSYIEKREIEEQNKREKIIQSNNKSSDENKFRENLKQVKENLRNV
jgi:hypothetical protein